MFNVTIIYNDNSEWFVGQFPSLAAANEWIANEKLQPYTLQSTIFHIDEIIQPVIQRPGA